ncbi:MAG TPA: hypothetical protein VK809_08495 [Bacteroidia bacterium]|jgi:hypothetical protein|nr:hypothetical protein [Bacteroidia bacterium]
MSTAELKYTLFKVIDVINDSTTLKEIYSFVSKKADADFWDNLSEEQKLEIETTLKNLDAGMGIPNEKVMSQYKGKYL